MKIKTRNRLIYFLIIFFLIITLFLWFFSRIRSEGENTLKLSRIDNVSYSNNPSLEYNKNLSFAKGVDFKIAIYSKTRSPIEKFDYKNNDVFIYKLPVKNNKPLSQVLKIKYVQVSPPSNTAYYELTSPYTYTRPDSFYTAPDKYDILYRAGKPDSGMEINLTLSGSDIKILKKTDTAYSCYAQLGNFSVNYNNSDTMDFYGGKKSNVNVQSLPIQISFKKKREYYYMTLMIKRG